jgi:hypothetical protein
VLSDARLVDAAGRVVREAKELTLCPNVPVSIALDEGPRGRDTGSHAVKRDGAAAKR